MMLGGMPVIGWKLALFGSGRWGRRGEQVSSKTSGKCPQTLAGAQKLLARTLSGAVVVMANGDVASLQHKFSRRANSTCISEQAKLALAHLRALLGRPVRIFAVAELRSRPPLRSLRFGFRSARLVADPLSGAPISDTYICQASS
ncbi:hypothetical protein NL676_032385 [Syzygium grande]|nr:hypothetical protein NL676_032385 [Syzygium grande]